MREEIIQDDDYVLGLANDEVTYPNPIYRHERVVRSMLLTELVAIWLRDELPLKDVLRKVDDLDMFDCESTMNWVGQFNSWEGYRDICDVVWEFMEKQDEEF